jgi:hypothetical protein
MFSLHGSYTGDRYVELLLVVTLGVTSCRVRPGSSRGDWSGTQRCGMSSCSLRSSCASGIRF